MRRLPPIRPVTSLDIVTYAVEVPDGEGYKTLCTFNVEQDAKDSINHIRGARVKPVTTLMSHPAIRPPSRRP